MILRPDERTCVFIDGASLYYASRTLGFDVDYRDLLTMFRARTRLTRAYYYAAMPETDDYSPLRPLTDWLAYNGYALVTKTAREFTDHSGRRRIKGNVDVELAVDLIEMASKIDHAVIFSGDSDLRRAVEAAQNRGARVTAVSSVRASPPLIGDDLRRQVDSFVELGDIAQDFTRRRQEARTPLPPARHPADQLSEESSFP